MIKVFTTNKDGKIELTKDELKKLLDEAYWEGYRANSTVYTYQTPNWSPYQWSVTTSSTCSTANDCKIKPGDIASGIIDTDYGVGVMHEPKEE